MPTSKLPPPWRYPRAWSRSTSGWPRLPVSTGRRCASGMSAHWLRGFCRAQRAPCPTWHRTGAAFTRSSSRKGVTLLLLWEEYVAEHAEERTWRYTQFCEHYKAFTRRLKRSMRQHRRAGEKLFIDFAGSTVALLDGSNAHVFVSALGASSYTFAGATGAERLEDWIESMTRALTFYGGVPQLIVPDNPRALISQPDRYEPQAHATVLDFARHYGTSVLPARPRSPRDKATVESAVQVVTRWILARLRHQRFASVYELDGAIAALLPALNERAFQKLPGSRASVFAADRSPGAHGAAGKPLRAGPLQERQGPHRLPRRDRWPPLQRPARPRGPGPRCAYHRSRGGVARAAATASRATCARRAAVSSAP